MKKKARKNEPFGLHLMLDAYRCGKRPLKNKNLVFKILDEMPGMLGMKKLTEPQVVFANPNGIRDPGGYSGFVMIQESHISLHTFIKRRFITADVYSCKHFDYLVAIDYFKKAFNTEDVEFHLEQRGIRYPSENID